jgi:tetratricopeptide (TPR) repeat protein
MGNAEWGLRLGLALFRFWERGEHLAEGRRRLGALLDLGPEGPEAVPGLRAKAMFAAGVLAHIQGDMEEGSALHARCLEFHRGRGDRWGIAVTLIALGNQYTAQGEYERARGALEESFAVWQQLGDDTGCARALSNLAFVARSQGRFEESRGLYQRAAAMFQRLGNRLNHAWALDHEGDVAREQGQLDSARQLYDEALATFRDLDDVWGISSATTDLGNIARQRGDYAAAHRLYREALARFVELDHRRGIARLLESLACLAAEEGQAERGLTLAAAAAVLRERVGAPPSTAVRAELEHSLSAMQGRLGAEASRGAWEAGAALTVGEAVGLACAGGEARAGRQ